MKDQEKIFLKAVIDDQEHQLYKRQNVEDIAGKLGINPKQAYYLVHKWKFWSYGITWRTGWINDFARAKSYLKDPDSDRGKI